MTRVPTVRILSLWLTVSAMTAVSGCSAAGAATGEQPGQIAEQLIAQPPAGWQQVGRTSLTALRRAVFVPDGESATDWTRRITFESMADQPLPDPIEFIELLAEGRDRDCGTFEAHPTFAGLENGFATAVYLLVCHRDRSSEQSEITMMKTIRGGEFFYVITRARRGPPIEKPADPAETGAQAPDLPVDETVVGAWSLYMKSITVCDASAEHPCP